MGRPPQLRLGQVLDPSDAPDAARGEAAWRQCSVIAARASARFVTLSGALLLAGCTLPVNQYALHKQALTCEEANTYAYRTLQNLGYTVTALEPAAPGQPGRVHGSRDVKSYGVHTVTVVVKCNGHTADVNASEDGKFLGQVDFKRAFYLSFTSSVSMAAADAAAAASGQRAPSAGLQVLLKPVRGLAAKLELGLDLAAAGVLPVHVTLSNGTARVYTLDPTEDIVLAKADGTRVRPMRVAEVARAVVAVPGTSPAPGSHPTDTAAVRRRLKAQQLSTHAVAAHQIIKGYLFFPLAPYVKGRVSLEDRQTEETEGFVVEF
jgi:hypothetical protein